MSDQITSTIAQLMFRSCPVLDFPALVADLKAALEDCPARDCSLDWDHDDVAIFELDNARIFLSLASDLSGRYEACLTVGVGASDIRDSDSGIAAHQGAIARLLADRINTRFMSDRMLWKHSPQPATVELIDKMVEEISGDIPTHPGLPVTDAADLDRMLQRYDAETAEQTSELAPEVPARQTRPVRPQRPAYSTARPGTMRQRPANRFGMTPEPASPANDMPVVPHPMLAELREIRAALHDADAPSQGGIRSTLSWPSKLRELKLVRTTTLAATTLGIMISLSTHHDSVQLFNNF